MTNQNQNPIGNSGSLEDCHTNLYALTDIAGIQYKKFISNKDGYVNSLDDPILILYTKCLQSGILSSWNKAKKDEKSNLSDMSGYIRELWIFWYDGNDPFAMKNITVPNTLKEDDHGNWKNGLTYEIRSILFKALNTNFERYFLTKGFVRMGPWIQMPYRLNKHSESQYGFNVKFFLHGESTICGAIDVRNVSMVRQITMKDLLECNNHYEKEVLLSPYAVRACVTGKGFKEDDSNVKQLYEEWFKYYPLVFPQNYLKTSMDSLNNLKKFPSNSDLLNSPPKFIEVTTGSCKMRYPSCLVCVKMEDDNDTKPNQKENRKRKFNQLDVPDGHLFSYTARRFSDRILKEIMIPLTKCKRESNEKSQMKYKPDIKPWKYCNPFWKGSCTCKRSTESKNAKGEQIETLRNGDKTFHRKLQNFDIPFTKSLFSKNSQQFDFNSNKQISISRLDSCCDRSTSPVNNVSNDPIMPTLSPQLPSNSDSSFPQQLPVNTPLSISTSNSAGKLNSGNFGLQSDSNHFTDFNDKISNKPIISCYNQTSINNFNQNTTSANSTISSRTPPPPSITPSSIMPNNFNNNKADVSINNDIHQAMTSESSDGNYNKKLVDSLPPGIEINQKSVLSTAHVTSNISVVSKPSLNMKSIYFHPTENVQDINLFPSILNSGLQANDYSFNGDNYNRDSIVNYSTKFDDVYQMSLINNSWLTTQSLESTLECSPAIKKLKTFINLNNGSCIAGYNHNQPIQDSLSNDSLNKLNTLSTKGHRNYMPTAIEKNEKTSLIPDQIFDDSDEEESSQRLEMSYTKSYLSPNNSQLKVLRSSNPYKFSGTSLLSSGGAGCVTAIELSLMYPTPPSLEGVMTSIGSPIERRGDQMITPISSLRSLENNFNENQLNSLSMCGQNWEEIDKDWCIPPINTSLFSSGLKYSKQPEIPKQMRLLSFNHRRLQYQRNKLKRQNIDSEHKVIDRFLPAAAINSLYNHSRRPNNLGPSSFYPQMSFPSINFGLSRFPSGTQRFSLTSGQNSAPITPASVCTNPPSVESSIGGTPRNIDYHNPSSTGFNRPQVVQSSPIIAKSPRIGIPNQHQLGTPGPISSCSINYSSHININSLYFNVLLSDSILNVYKDHNFDSCNICICSMSVMGNDVGLYIEDYQQNIQQAYVNRSISTDDLMNGTCSSKDCKCGFSAIMNRHYAINANLFYEDEVEITGIKKPHIYANQSNNNKDKPDNISKLYGTQILSVYDEFGLSFLLDYIRHKNTVNKEKIPENMVEFQDYNVAIYHALEQACESPERVPIEKDKIWLSKLYYFKKDVLIPKNYNDQIRLLMTLRPLLQEAVSNTRLLESSYTVDGPLTWKTFHRLAGRGNVESCEPQPLPKFQVFCGKHSSKESNFNTNSIPGLGSLTDSNLSASQTSTHQFSNTNNGFISAQNNFNFQASKKSSSLSYFSIEGNPLCLTNGYPDKEKECLTISPYAVREWDKLNLEPIFRPKEIAYAIVTPTDSGKVLQKSLITYFKELNNVYQGCRLGHHFSFRSEGIKDDIHSSFIEINTEYWNDKGTVPPTLQPASLQKFWLKELSKVMSISCAEDFISKVVWYVKQCEVQTITILGQYGVNKRNGSKSSLFPTCDNHKKESYNVNQTLELLLSPGNGCGQLSKVLNTKVWSSDKDVYLTIYVINPFVHGQDISGPTYRLSNQWMNKLCHKISKSLHPSWKSRVTFQLLSINKIFDATQFGANVGVGDNDGSSIGGRDSSATSSTSCTSSSVSWSIKWCRQWYWKSTAFAVYNSVRRKICRVGGLQSILNGKGTSLNLCSSSKCSMARGCSSDDECESAASLINANRCQTKCGPTGFNEKLTSDYLKKFVLESQDQLNKSQNSMSIYAPPYILAPSKSLYYQTTAFSGQQTSLNSNHINSSASESWGYIGDKSNVLFIAYCLSFDQKWLLATCSDLLGTVQRQVQINIMVPQLHLRKMASPRKIGLGKLWDFIQEVVSDSCQPWRVVIGRLGRAGHGELKSWNGLLSRQNLIGVNQRFRDECSMCHVWNSGQNHGPSGAMGSVGRSDMCALQIPTIISGCFVSLECHSSFRIFPGSVKPEERASSNLPLCTPRDVSVTHILVFPTSTSAGAVQNDQDLPGGGGGVNDMNLEELLKFGNEGLEELGNINNIDMTDNIGAFSSEFDSFGRMPGLGSLLPRTNSSSHHDLGVMDPSCGLEAFSCYPGSFNNQEDGQVLMQQPLAMGYYLSTTEPGPLPSWFYSACPPLNSMTDPSLPSCFKAALHLQTSLISQEDGSSGLSGGTSGGGAGGAAPHPLDSHQTSDVLRFVLESYHALSWLTFDPSINDRRSCLPIHFLFLAQLYEADQSFM